MSNLIQLKGDALTADGKGPKDVPVADILKHVDELVDNDFVVFSKSYCPFCSSTKKLLAKDFKDTQFKVVELDQLPHGTEIQAHLQKRSGQRTVPNTFIKGKHIGGNDDLTQKARNGELKKVIDAAA